MTCERCFHYKVCEGHLILNDIPMELCGLFKDKSHIVEIPCNVGDTVYANCDTFNKVIGYSVKDIHIDEEATTFFATAFDCYYNEFLDEIEFKIDEIGKTVFLTEEEAESKLKKLRKNATD